MNYLTESKVKEVGRFYLMNGEKPAFPGVVNIQANLSISNLELDSLKFGFKK